MHKLKRKLLNGNLDVFGLSIKWNVRRATRRQKTLSIAVFQSPYCLHIGPGPNWIKPNERWINIDIDPQWGDMIVDFQQFTGFPIEANTVECIYGSHVFEHMSICVTDAVFSECHRVLQPGGVMRLVIPNVERSIREYLAGNDDFSLFRCRIERARKKYGLDYTLFDCLREDFLSRSGQEELLGEKALAHQNAWDYESICRDLHRAGFKEVHNSALRQSRFKHFFNFEGSYQCEALEDDRSLYVEAIKLKS